MEKKDNIFSVYINFTFWNILNLCVNKKNSLSKLNGIVYYGSFQYFTSSKATSVV